MCGVCVCVLVCVRVCVDDARNRTNRRYDAKKGSRSCITRSSMSKTRNEENEVEEAIHCFVVETRDLLEENMTTGLTEIAIMPWKLLNTVFEEGLTCSAKQGIKGQISLESQGGYLLSTLASQSQ